VPCLTLIHKYFNYIYNKYNTRFGKGMLSSVEGEAVTQMSPFGLDDGYNKQE